MTMRPSEAKPMKPMHTPGPWKFDTGKGRIVGPNDQVVSLMVHAGDYNVKETFANADMIADAPALVASLKQMLDAYWGEGDGHPDPDFIAEAKRLVAGR